MKHLSISTVVAILFLVACGISPNDLTTLTITPETQTPVPNTATPTSTLTATLVPTPTITPTPEPVVLADFSAEMTGVDVHGNMTCIDYNGDANDLNDMELHADFSQEGKMLEYNIPIEAVGDQMCFEVLDAKYRTGLPVTMLLRVSSNDELVVENGEQEIVLDAYTVVPFLRWIFGEYGVDKNVYGGFNYRHQAWDLSYSSEEFLYSVGTPIYAVGYGEIIKNTLWYPFGEDAGYITNIYAKLDDVGLLWQFGHIDADDPPVPYGTCVPFEPGDLLARIDAAQPRTTPHVHFALQTIVVSYREAMVFDDNFVNPFSKDPFYDGMTGLQYGLWLPEYLPQDVKDTIDSGFFVVNTAIGGGYSLRLTSMNINMNRPPDFNCLATDYW